MKKVLIFDTCILCIWLKLPNFDKCGPSTDLWDWQRVSEKIDNETTNKTIFVLPLASIIETGNHITHIPHSKLDCAQALASIMRQCALEQTPWAAFSDQSILWSSDKLNSLSNTWPDLAVQNLSLGDATIKNVAEYYSSMGYNVEIFTADQGLQAYAPNNPPEIPRRRK
ncbi:MAG: hypothetical protein WCV63_10920 [Negativicutes bacterium]|jgi:hypothetical protein